MGTGIGESLFLVGRHWDRIGGVNPCLTIITDRSWSASCFE